MVTCKETTTYANDCDGSGCTNMQQLAGNRIMIGSIIPSGSSWIGLTVKQVKIWLVRVGTLDNDTQRLYCRIYNDNSTISVEETATEVIAPNAGIGTTASEFTFNFPTGVTLAEDYKIGIQIDTSTSTADTNYITCRGYYPRTTDNADVIQTEYDGSFNNETQYNVQFKVCSAPTPTSSGTRLPPPPLIARF